MALSPAAGRDVPTGVHRVQYRLATDDGKESVFDLEFDAASFRLRRTSVRPLPAWTALAFHRCPGCTLDAAASPHCPFAASLADVVGQLDGVVSHDAVGLDVTTIERRISQRTTAQRAISSLMGLLSATCGCPRTAFFRPMARFHLPLATEEETTFRVVSLYLLAQHLCAAGGGSPETGLGGLKDIYGGVHAVNVAVAKRLRAATSTDSSVNALVMLDVFAIGIPFAIDDVLESIRPLFAGGRTT